MALQDLVAKNKQKTLRRGPGGVLTEESAEEIQTLAGKAGLTAPPITPSGQGMLGANADQQKMAGTPAQKQAALSLSMSSTNNLQDAVRTAQSRTQMTGQEQQSEEKSENLKALGGLGDRVNDFINAQRQKLQTATETAAQSGQGVAVEAAGSFKGQDVSQLKDLLGQLRADPTNMEVMLQVNEALGYDINRQLDPAEIDQLYESAVSSISRGTAGNIDDDLTAEDLLAQGNLGYSREQLSELLGIPLEQVGNLSVGQIRDQINKLADEEFSRTAELEQQATSNQLGLAERGLARQAAREMSATGVRSSEADVANLENQIASADQVQFGGKSYSVEDLLKDETISAIVAEYMSSDPDSEIRRQIDASEPALKAFIEKNQNILADASRNLQTQATEFRTIQTDNRRAATMDGLLSNVVAEKLIPQFSKLSASRLDPNQIPVLAAANTYDENGRRQYAQNINTLAQDIPEVMDEMATLQPDELRGLGFNSSNGKWTNYVRDHRRYKEIASIPDQDINSIAAQVFDVGGNVDFQKDLALNNARKTLGFGGTTGSLGFLDANEDGQMDSGESIKSRLISREPSLRLALEGQETVKARQGYQPPQPPPVMSGGDRTLQNILNRDEGELQAVLMAHFGNAAADGTLDANELNQAMQPQDWFTDDQLRARQIEIDYLKNHANLGGHEQNELQRMVSDSKKLLSGRVLNQGDIRAASELNLDRPSKGQVDQLRSVIGKLQSYSNSPGDHYDRAMLDGKINELQARVDEANKKRALQQIGLWRGGSQLNQSDYRDPDVRSWIDRLGGLGNRG